MQPLIAHRIYVYLVLTASRHVRSKLLSSELVEAMRPAFNIKAELLELSAALA